MCLLYCSQPLAQSTNIRDCDDGATYPADNNPERFIGVCRLEGSTSTFTYDDTVPQQGEIQFTVRSCSTWWGEICEHAIPYTATTTGDNNGNNFILRRDRGNQTAEIRLAYSSGGSTETLNPATNGSQLFPGAANGAHTPASITVTMVDPGTNLRNGIYSGTFELTIDQCGGSYTWGVDPEACDGRYATTELLNLTFHIELRIRSRIRIHGLDDMFLTATTEGAESSQTFCVWTTGDALFRLTADSQNGSGQFLLRGIDLVPYSAEIEHLPSARVEALTEGVRSTNNWPGHNSRSCRNLSQENMQITIRVDPASLEGAQDSNYTDTLTLTVELE